MRSCGMLANKCKMVHNSHILAPKSFVTCYLSRWLHYLSLLSCTTMSTISRITNPELSITLIEFAVQRQEDSASPDRRLAAAGAQPGWHRHELPASGPSLSYFLSASASTTSLSSAATTGTVWSTCANLYPHTDDQTGEMRLS